MLSDKQDKASALDHLPVEPTRLPNGGRRRLIGEKFLVLCHFCDKDGQRNPKRWGEQRELTSNVTTRTTSALRWGFFCCLTPSQSRRIISGRYCFDVVNVRHTRDRSRNRKQRWLLAFKETNQNAQEVKKLRGSFLISCVFWFSSEIACWDSSGKG